MSVKLLRKKLVLKFGLSWGKFWLLCTLWQNLHLFLNILKLRKGKKLVKKKRFWKCGLRNPQEELVWSQESAKDCRRFHSFLFYIFLVSALFFKSSFLDTETTFSQVRDKILKTAVSNNFFGFLLSNLKCLNKRNTNLIWKS